MPTTSRSLIVSIRNGAIGGMAASVVMAMYAMIAAATYQDTGFFTPLHHISALLGSEKSMMASMMAAMETGDMFTFTLGAAVVGLLIHMVTCAMYGIIFALLTQSIRGIVLVAAGAVYGVAVLLFSAYVGLPIAAAITGSGDAISDMADMVGWGTFAIEHIIFGAVLGAGLLVLRGERAWTSATSSAHAAA